MEVKVLVTQSCLTLWDPTDCSQLGTSVHGMFQDILHSILQGIFPSQGLTPGILHCRQILYRLSCQGSIFLALLTLQEEYKLG